MNAITERCIRVHIDDPDLYDKKTKELRLRKLVERCQATRDAFWLYELYFPVMFNICGHLQEYFPQEFIWYKEAEGIEGWWPDWDEHPVEAEDFQDDIDTYFQMLWWEGGWALDEFTIDEAIVFHTPSEPTMKQGVLF